MPLNPPPFEQMPIDQRGMFDVPWHFWLNQIRDDIDANKAALDILDPGDNSQLRADVDTNTADIAELNSNLSALSLEVEVLTATINDLDLDLAVKIHQTTRVTTTYTILAADEILFANTDSAGFTVTLPPGIEGTHYKVSNTGISGNDITLTPNGTEKLVGINSSFTLTDGEAMDIYFNATDGWA